MKLLNLGCGYPRLTGDQWANVDNLKAQLPEGTPERTNLDAEANYVEHDLLTAPLPFEDGTFDGVLASHVFEHFDAQDGLRVMRDCHRVLRRGGVLLVSVPDASYFRRVHHEDRNENWQRLFGVTDKANPIPTFFEAALWFDQHKAMLTEDALWCYFTRAGFEPCNDRESHLPTIEMKSKLNRRLFSVEMLGLKR